MAIEAPDPDVFGGPLAQWADGVESLRAAREAYALAAKREGYLIALKLVLEHTEDIYARCSLRKDGGGMGVAKNIELKIKRLLADEGEADR